MPDTMQPAHSVGHGELEFALGGAVVTSANRHVDHLGAEHGGGRFEPFQVIAAVSNDDLGDRS